MATRPIRIHQYHKNKLVWVFCLHNCHGTLSCLQKCNHFKHMAEFYTQSCSLCRVVCICFRRGEKKVSDDILQIPVDDFQNYFFFLEPTVSFGSLFPSAINKNKSYLKTCYFEMSLQYSTYFLGKWWRNKKPLVAFHILEGRLYLCIEYV